MSTKNLVRNLFFALIVASFGMAALSSCGSNVEYEEAEVPTQGLITTVQEVQPDEIYNLAAMSHVHVSFEEPEYTANTDGIGTLRILEAVRLLGLTKKTRIYQTVLYYIKYGKEYVQICF